MPAFVYILRCADGRRYYGSTTDLRRRLGEHRAGMTATTRIRLPVELVYFEQHVTLTAARRRERALKNGHTRRETIDLLIANIPPGRLAPVVEQPRVKGSSTSAGRRSITT